VELTRETGEEGERKEEGKVVHKDENLKTTASGLWRMGRGEGGVLFPCVLRKRRRGAGKKGEKKGKLVGRGPKG